MKKFLFSIIAFGFVFLTNCTKETEYKFKGFKGFKEQMVVLAQLSPKDGLSVRISKTISPSSQGVLVQSLLLNDAQVKFYEDDKLIAIVPHVENGQYLLDSAKLQLKVGATYTVEANHNTFGQLVSEKVILPAAPKVSNTKISISPVPDPNGRPQLRLSYRLDDPLEENYYFVTAQIPFKGKPTLLFPIYVDLKLKNLCEPQGAFQVIKDQCFNLYQTQYSSSAF
jgi:Domain of unknown function (DUF4249)